MAEQPFIPSLRGDVQAAQGTYIRRPADDQLFAACLNNEFAYVLACRQIGKSSLKNAVAERLIGQGVRVARIDLNRIGQTVTGAEQWYFSLLDEIARNLGLTTDTDEWWGQQSQLSTWPQRFVHFLDEIVLIEIKHPIVIFIDEIDMTLDLSFTNDLFAMIRSLYNDRAQNSAYRRLTFVLLGVASPDELIDDQKRTPFNVGKAISIRDFTREECTPLRLFIETHHPDQGSAYFEQIYQWTNGHPYLTQKLCYAVACATQSDEPALVEWFVNEIFFKKGERTEDNLDFVQTRVLGDRYVVPMIQTYAKILRHRAVRDDKKSSAINRLQLYGLVVAEHDHLRVRNRIYEKAFDQAWCKENNPLNWNRVAAYGLACVLVLVVGWFGFALWHDNNLIPSQAQKAQLDFYQAHEPEDRVKSLATLFGLDSRYILQRSTIYGDQARALFFSLPNSKDQLDLLKVNDNNILIVIESLYRALADVNKTDRSTPLLQAMVDDLHKLNPSKETSDLLAEITYWVEGRNSSKQGQLQPALNAYNQAIAVNGENLSTRYERARTNIELAQYGQALADLDQIIATVRQSGEPTPSEPTISATFTMTPTPTFTPTSTQTGNSGKGIPSSTSTVTANSSPQSNDTPTPIATPVPDAVLSEFSTVDQIIAAVRNMINNNSKLMSFAIQSNQQTYLNLIAYRLVTTPVAIALALTHTPSQTPSLTPTISTFTPSPPPVPSNSLSTDGPTPTFILSPALVPPTIGTKLPLLTPLASAINTPMLVPSLTGRIAYPVQKADHRDIHVYCIEQDQECQMLDHMSQPDFDGGGYLLVNGNGNGWDTIVRMNPAYGNWNPASLHPEDSHPRWAPGGDRLIFDSKFAGPSHQSYIYGQERLNQKPNEEGYRLQYNETKLLGSHPIYLPSYDIAYLGCDFWNTGSHCGIYGARDRNPIGQKPVQFTDKTDDLPTDNLNGQVLFMSTRAGNWEVYSVGAPFDIRNLTNSPNTCDGLATASPDGNYIAFLSQRNGVWSIYVVRADGSDSNNPHKLYDVGDIGFGCGDDIWRDEYMSWGVSAK